MLPEIMNLGGESVDLSLKHCWFNSLLLQFYSYVSGNSAYTSCSIPLEPHVRGFGFHDHFGQGAILGPLDGYSKVALRRLPRDEHVEVTRFLCKLPAVAIESC